MTKPTTITCGDLAALGSAWDSLHQHDPRRMETEWDTLCYCHTSGPPTEAYVRCREPIIQPVGADYLLILCCLCSPEYGDVLRRRHEARPGDNLFHWLRDQCRQAVEYRESRSLDPGPCPKDMDVEAAAVELGANR